MMSPVIVSSLSLVVSLSCLLTGAGATLQEPEEVSLDGVYSFFTSELVIRKFYVLLIFQVLTYNIKSNINIIKTKFTFIAHIHECWVALNS